MSATGSKPYELPLVAVGVLGLTRAVGVQSEGERAGGTSCGPYEVAVGPCPQALPAVTNPHPGVPLAAAL